jgi:hypothetical protein
VAAIERLIGRNIPLMERPAERPTAASSRAPQDAERSKRDRKTPPRLEHVLAAVTRLDDVRARRAERPRREPEKVTAGGGHLPAFLLRPARAKA